MDVGILFVEQFFRLTENGCGPHLSVGKWRRHSKSRRSIVDERMPTKFRRH